MAAWLIPVGVGASAVAKTPIRYLVKWITPTGKTATKSVGSKEAGIKALGQKGFKPSDIKVETGKGVRAKGAEPKKTKSSGRWEKFRKHGSQVEGSEKARAEDRGKTMKKQHGGMTHVGLYPAEERGEDISRSTGTLSQAKRKRYMNKGGIVGDKKQGYKARKDESIAQRVKKKRTKKQLVASRDESYGKWGKGKGKGKINHADGNKLVASLYD